ncbi:unnamed protein product [Rhodiola kirilowii]
MAQQRPFQMLNDTTYTKIFVGGLAWETQRDTMRRYFEQFGEIHEAVVITDKNTGRSKGYGFVTFKDPAAAARACQNQSPVIDGRRANCNLAILGANKPYPQHPPQPHGSVARFRPVPGLVPQPAYHPTSSNYVPQSAGQYPVPYSPYGYPGYSQNAIYPPLAYYGGFGSQQYSPYFSTVVPGQPNAYPNIYPYYGHYGSQIGQAQGYGTQYPPQMVQNPYLQQSYNSAGILALPSNLHPTPTTASIVLTTRVSTTPVASATNSSVTIASEQNSST